MLNKLSATVVSSVGATVLSSAVDVTTSVASSAVVVTAAAASSSVSSAAAFFFRSATTTSSLSVFSPVFSPAASFSLVGGPSAAGFV